MAQTAGSNKFEKWELPETMSTLVTKQNTNLEKIDTAIDAARSRAGGSIAMSNNTFYAPEGKLSYYVQNNICQVTARFRCTAYTGELQVMASGLPKPIDNRTYFNITPNGGSAFASLAIMIDVNGLFRVRYGAVNQTYYATISYMVA